MTTVKCVVWDLDGTVWPGVAIEQDAAPEPFPQALHAMDVLADRGIVSSAASRTAPVVAEALAAQPALAQRLVVPRLSWGDKSAALRGIAADLGISPDAMAFVDDNPFERAEVADALPEVLVLSPADLYARLDDPVLRPDVVTVDARARVERYRQEERRSSAEAAHPGDRASFLRSCDIRLALARARADDLERVAELSERTHRFNSTGEVWNVERLRGVLDDPAWLPLVGRLDDRFGAYGTVVAALVERPAAEPGTWWLRLLAVSCRAAGRSVPEGVLGRLVALAAADGVRSLRVDVRPGRANLELRVLLRAAGFRADRADDDGRTAVVRDTDEPLPVPGWLHLEEAL